jgi:hypothetical protein
MFQFMPLENVMLVRSWQVAGPWDNDENRNFRDGNEEMKKATREYYEKFITPPDEPDYPFWGVFTRQPQHRPWQLRSVEGTNPQLKLSAAGRLYHEMLWIQTQEDVKVQLKFYTRPQTQLRVSIVGESMEDPQNFVFNSVKDEDRQATVTLKKGWNRVLLRNYSYGYGLEPGMTIHAAPETLWKLRLSAAPRAE